ncbi:hypothetical protein BOX15_Mlig025076g2, partial [Macrostomum lignano]
PASKRSSSSSMTSLLATQLNKLRLPEGQTASADYRRRKSLIHSATELNKIDAAAHLERAQKAFQHLLNVDPSLQEFQDCFFSEERLNFEPSMQTPSSKAALDQIIEHFYLRVSQHLLLGITLDALEWLVYRFQTHQYNMEAMLQAVLPYHSTNLFPKFLQLFEFTAQNRRWHWLKPLANQGQPLSRAELVRMTGRDESLLAFVCQLVQRAFKAFGAEDEPRLRLFVNLFAQVTLGLLMKPLDEVRLSKCVNCLNFYLLKGMRSAAACYRHSAYQIVQLLAVKHRLSGSVLHMWIKRLLKSSAKRDPAEVCLLVATLCRTQKCQVPDEFTERFLELCSACKSNVLNEFPDIVSRSTEAVDIVFDENHSLVAKDAAGVAMETKPVDIDASMDEKNGGDQTEAPESRKEDKLKEKKLAARLAAENAVMKLFQTPGLPAESVPAAAAESAETAPDETGNATSDANQSQKPQVAPEPAPSSPILVIGSLIRLLASPAQSVRRDSLGSLRRLLSLARPDGCSAGPTDESEEDAQMWDTVEALLNDARAIQHDRQWVMRQQLGPACCRLVWLSMAELAGGLAGCSALTPIQRRCLLGQLHFLPELRLAALVAEQPGGGDDDGGRDSEAGGLGLLLRMIRLPDPSLARAVAMKVTPAVFNTLSPAMKLAYLTEGLGSTPLTEDPDVLALACGYSVETVVYLDALANLFGLVPTRASIQNLSAKRRSISSQGNAYLDMPASDKRQARLLFRMASCSDASADQLDSGLQLVIRLLEVLQILVQAHARLDASNQQAEEESTTLVSDIGLCLVAADRAAARTPDADCRVSGLADLIPLQAVLSCARAVSDRSCQYAAVGLLCRLCRLAPASAAACCRGLVDFLVGGGFFGRADRHSEELWRGLVGSVLPAYARCNPSSVPLLAQLLSAYEDMSPSRRPEVFAQLVESVGTGAHLWALLLLLNRRARSLQQQRRKRRQPQSQQQRLSESEDGEADGQFEPPTRRRRLSTSVSISEDPPAAAAQQQQPQQFDSLGSSVLAEFAVSEQLLACAGLIRYLLRRIDPASLGASSSAVSALPFLELDKAADEFGGDEYFGFDELDEELESALLPATAAAAELPAQLESALNFVGAHLSRRDLLAGMAEAENSAAAMTQLFEALVNALLWATGPQQQQQGRHLASLCVRTIERAEQAVPGVQFLRVVCGLLARPEPAVRRKALDLMLSKLTGLDRAGAVPLLRQSLLDCLAGVERNYQGSQVALICGRELVRLLGASEPKLVLNFCLGIAASSSCLPPPLLPTSTADSNSGSSSSSSSWESFGCALLVFAESVKQLGIEALPLVARLVPKLLPRLRPTVADQRPPGVVLLASFAFLQQCTVTMVDLMVPYLAQLLPVTVELMLSADSQLRPKLRSVLSSVARGVHPAQLLPALQDCLKPHQQQQPWLRAEHWARLLRLNLEMTVASEAANRLEEDDSDSADAAGSLADFEAELSDLFSSLLGCVFGSGEEDADGDSGTDDDGSESSGTESEEEGEGGAEDRAKGRLVAQLAACLAPLPPATRAMLLQSLQDWAAGSASREAAFHRLMAVALASQSGRVSGLAGLLCELDAPQHAAALLELPGADSQQPRPSRQLSRWLLACLAALFKAAGGSSGLGLDLLDSIGSLLVDRLAAAADPAERLLDCLAAYAQGSSEDEALLKPLVRRLCDRGCRHPDGSVRLASLRAIQRLLDCLGDVFIDSLAADCVPALAELAEDDSEEVERLAQRLLADIEQRAGEPLEL